MNINKFVAALVPSMGKSQLLSQIDIGLEQLTTDVLPAYKNALKNNLFGRNYNPRSDWFKQRTQQFTAIVDTKGKSLVESTEALMENCVHRLNWVRKQVEGNFEETTFRDGISYPKAMVVYLMEAVLFEISYARRLLLAIYGYEVPAYFPNAESAPMLPYSDYDIRRLEAEFVTFANIAAALLHQRNIDELLEAVPDLIVDVKDKNGAAASMGHHKLSPLALGFVKPDWNPFYRVGRWVAEWQVKQLNKAKKEKMALDLYLIQLKTARDGKQNAAVEHQIEKITSDIQRLSYEIDQKESDYLKR